MNFFFKSIWTVSIYSLQWYKVTIGRIITIGSWLWIENKKGRNQINYPDFLTIKCRSLELNYVNEKDLLFHFMLNIKLISNQGKFVTRYVILECTQDCFFTIIKAIFLKSCVLPNNKLFWLTFKFSFVCICCS